MRIHIRAPGVDELAGGHKRILADGTLAHDVLARIRAHLIRIGSGNELHRVHNHLLRDIGRYQARVVALLGQVLRILIGRTVGQIEGPVQILLNGLLLGSRGRESLRPCS